MAGFLGIGGKGKEPRKPKDWALIGAVTFIVGTIFVILANTYIERFPLGTKTFIFVLLIGVALYGTIRLLRFKSPFEKANMGYVIVLILVLVAIIFLIIQFKILPSFEIVAKNLASIVGV